MNNLTKARKPHSCSLCSLKIEKGEQYVYERITPWSHPDNESFGNYRAHQKCNKVWGEVGGEYDYICPNSVEFLNERTQEEI